MENNIEPSKNKVLLKAISYVFVYFAISIVVGMVAVLLGISIEKYTFPVAAVVTILSAIYVLSRLKKEENISIKERLSVTKLNFKFLFGSTLSVICLAIILDFIMLSIFKWKPEELEVITLSFKGALMVISIVIIAPIFEEFIFRFGIIEKLGNKYSKTYTIIFSSIIFTAVHFYGVYGSVAVFILAVIMGYIYVHTRSLIYVMFIHFVNNIFATVQNNVVNNNPNSFFSSFSSFGIELIVVFVLLVIGFFLAYSQKDKVKYIKQ